MGNGKRLLDLVFVWSLPEVWEALLANLTESRWKVGKAPCRRLGVEVVVTSRKHMNGSDGALQGWLGPGNILCMSSPDSVSWLAERSE